MSSNLIDSSFLLKIFFCVEGRSLEFGDAAGTGGGVFSFTPGGAQHCIGVGFTFGAVYLVVIVQFIIGKIPWKALRTTHSTPHVRILKANPNEPNTITITNSSLQWRNNGNDSFTLEDTMA